jgi:hypothetical protein
VLLHKQSGQSTQDKLQCQILYAANPSKVMADHLLDLASLPPDLAALINAWPTLNAEVRGLLRALFQALGRAESQPGERERE